MTGSKLGVVTATPPLEETTADLYDYFSCITGDQRGVELRRAGLDQVYVDSFVLTSVKGGQNVRLDDAVQGVVVSFLPQNKPHPVK